MGANEFGLPTLQYAKDATQMFARDVLHYWIREFHVDGFRFDYLKMVGSAQDKGAPTLSKAARELRPDMAVEQHGRRNRGGREFLAGLADDQRAVPR